MSTARPTNTLPRSLRSYPPIGFIADDITGATDLASALAGRGLDTRLAFGSAAVPDDGGDAVVVALKIRSVPASEARAAATEAAEALRAVGAQQIFFKYCSTFDSTADGNIGPTTDALIDVSGARHVAHCPSYPANGRTVYLGHLFVGDELLSESPMRDHPLNPMRDPQLRRVLGEQTPRGVALVELSTVDAGADAVTVRLAETAGLTAGAHHVIADAVRDEDLDVIAEATAGDRLAAGGAAYGAAFAVAAHARAGHPPPVHQQRPVPPPGPAAILAGSLSRATREQVRAFDGPTLTLGVVDLVDGDYAVRRALDFADRRRACGPLLITTDHDAVGLRVGATGLSPAQVSRRIELAMGRIGIGLEGLGIRRLIVAGGETSGAVAEALALRSARIGPDISVGVPWLVAEDRELSVAFKSGNFGGPGFFRDALEVVRS
ncbi:four-carbon acid sugar kinase family protein [Mycobacterium sp. 21AC1]|uniref:3-oxo-tetronate kinase n=1 Tax=[Mycobacterium] appelbergii TaxID=2939269 RepID=UPI002938F8C0|nr:3-oxo-tetronate kinase [Mycobacterium sp. 21AC1]MDV3126014.1 four-carbon acid sugar kinase family protein [Mycobacterium sp. 21AC1]